MTGALPDPGCPTNWAAYNVPRLWAMVADEDNPESWRQVAALGDMADTVKDQKDRLLIARDALTQAWPPEKNPAAQAFVDQIDILVRNMDAQKATAEKNAAALGNIVDALRQAKDKIKPLYDKYLEDSDDSVPRWWDQAEDELDTQARQHMVAAEKTVATHAVQIVPPTPYRLNVGTDVNARKRGFGDADSPPVLHSSAPAGSGGSGRDGGGGVAVPHDPPPPLPGHEATIPVGAGSPPPSDVELAGVISPPSASLPTAVPPAAGGPASAPSAGLGQPGMIIGGPATPVSSAGVPVGRPSSGTVGPFGGGGRTAMPSGSVIGGAQPGRAGPPAVKPAPPSWLPGAPGQPGVTAGTKPSRGVAGGRGMPGGTPMAGMPIAPGRGRHDGDDAGVTFDPDNPWMTAEGVDPIIEPSRQRPRHDPGPGVIGWHG